MLTSEELLSLQKSSKATRFLMYTDQFGPKMYIAKVEHRACLITDTQEEAEVWDIRYDITKFLYYQTITGYDLKIQFI